MDSYDITAQELRRRQVQYTTHAVYEIARRTLAVVFGVPVDRKHNYIVPVVAVNVNAIHPDAKLAKNVEPCVRVQSWIRTGMVKEPKVYAIYDV